MNEAEPVFETKQVGVEKTETLEEILVELSDARSQILEDEFIEIADVDKIYREFLATANVGDTVIIPEFDLTTKRIS